MRLPYKKGYKTVHRPSVISIQQKAPQYYPIFFIHSEKTATVYML